MARGMREPPPTAGTLPLACLAEAVLELGLLIRRRCPQELDVKGSPLRLSGALFSPQPPSGQPGAPVCGSVHTSEHPVRAAEARTPPPLTVFAPAPVVPTKAPIPLA